MKMYVSDFLAATFADSDEQLPSTLVDAVLFGKVGCDTDDTTVGWFILLGKTVDVWIVPLGHDQNVGRRDGMQIWKSRYEIVLKLKVGLVVEFTRGDLAKDAIPHLRETLFDLGDQA